MRQLTFISRGCRYRQRRPAGQNQRGHIIEADLNIGWPILSPTIRWRLFIPLITRDQLRLKVIRRGVVALMDHTRSQLLLRTRQIIINRHLPQQRLHRLLTCFHTFTVLVCHHHCNHTLAFLTQVSTMV